MDNENRLLVKDQRFLDVYIKTYDIQKTAKVLGVSQATAYNIKAKPLVRQMLAELEANALTEMRGSVIQQLGGRVRSGKMTDKALLDTLNALNRTLDVAPSFNKETHELTQDDLAKIIQDTKMHLAQLQDVTPTDQIEGLAIEQDSGDIFE